MNRAPERRADPHDAQPPQELKCQVLVLPLEQLAHFSTVETSFFQAGEELAAGPVAIDSFEKPTAAGRARPWLRKRAYWPLAGIFAVVAACATLAVSRMDRAPRSLPQPTVSQQEPTPALPTPAQPTPTSAQLPAPAPAADLPVPPPAPAATGAVAAISDAPASPPTTTEAAAVPADDTALDACKKAYDQHRTKDVVSTCAQAFASGQPSADVAIMLAKTEFERGRSRLAFDWASKAIALDATRADAYVFLGSAEQAFGHKAAAKAAYQRYLRLSPHGRYAADLRAVIGSL
jgi:tetratricopeptide (TPR) repeat protein